MDFHLSEVSTKIILDVITTPSFEMSQENRQFLFATSFDHGRIVTVRRRANSAELMINISDSTEVIIRLNAFAKKMERLMTSQTSCSRSQFYPEISLDVIATPSF